MGYTNIIFFLLRKSVTLFDRYIRSVLAGNQSRVKV